jgi:hypothetical protein
LPASLWPLCSLTEKKSNKKKKGEGFALRKKKKRARLRCMSWTQPRLRLSCSSRAKKKERSEKKIKTAFYSSFLEPAIDSLELLVLLLVRVLDEVVHVRVEEQQVVVPVDTRRITHGQTITSPHTHTRRERGLLSVVGAELLLVVLPVEVVDRYNNVRNRRGKRLLKIKQACGGDVWSAVPSMVARQFSPTVWYLQKRVFWLLIFTQGSLLTLSDP